MPASAASAPAMSQVAPMVRRVSMPLTSAKDMLSATARISLPRRVRLRKMPVAEIHRARRVEAHGPHLAAGEELHGIAQHEGESGRDEEQLERARPRPP